MRLRKLIAAALVHPRAGRAALKGARRLREAGEEAGVLDVPVDDEVMPPDASGDEVDAAVKEGFRGAAEAIIGQVFDGGMDWEKAKGKLDKLMAAMADLDADTPGGALTESVRLEQKAEGRRLREWVGTITTDSKPTPAAVRNFARRITAR